MRLRDFFGGGWRVADFDEEDARRAGEVRAQLEREGKPIGAYDILIAGQALRRGHKLVTANSKEFARVKGLHWEDWTKGGSYKLELGHSRIAQARLERQEKRLEGKRK